MLTRPVVLRYGPVADRDGGPADDVECGDDPTRGDSLDSTHEGDQAGVREDDG